MDLANSIVVLAGQSMTLHTPHFSIAYNGLYTVSIFNDGKWTGGGPIHDDHYHAELFGLSPQLHRFHHQLAHHIIGCYYYKEPYSPVLWHAAHPDTVEFPENGHEEEWLVTALQYYATGVGTLAPPERNDTDALLALSMVCPLDRPVEVLRGLTEQARRIRPWTKKTNVTLGIGGRSLNTELECLSLS